MSMVENKMFYDKDAQISMSAIWFNFSNNLILIYNEYNVYSLM